MDKRVKLREPHPDELLDMNEVKKCCGGDIFYPRDLKDYDSEPMIKIILTWNNVPIIPSDDHGIY